MLQDYHDNEHGDLLNKVNKGERENETVGKY